jgi:large subunit ribosomal protein L25
MKSVPLTAYPRTLSRRGGSKKLRASGRIPAVIYGGQTTPQILEVDRKAMEDVMHHSASENVLVDLSVDKDSAGKRLALVQEVQHNALTGKAIHIDFHEIKEDEKVTVMVPVEPTGEATGVKNGGGVLEHVLFKVKARSLPKDLPDVIHVDVSHLEIGQAIHIGDIKPPAGVEILGDKHLTLLSVAAPVTEAQEAAADAASTTPGEVEMIKEKKEDGEAGAEKAPEKGAEKGAVKAEEKKPAEKKK